MNLEEQVSRELEGRDLLEPLATTRELGDRFGVSHVTVSRVLRRMADAGILWQAESGRYYRGAARERLSRPRPVGCLLRSLSAWSAWYEGIMAGVGRACERDGRGILVHPVPDLVRQAAPAAPARFLPEPRQRAAFDRYLERHLRETNRLLLDDCWSDRVIRAEAGRLKSARMLLRPAPVAGMEACYPDFRQGALLGLSHLFARGFREIGFVQPYAEYRTPLLLEEAFAEAFRSLGASPAKFEVFRSDGAEGFPGIVSRLKRRRSGRFALICPEDNFAVALKRRIEEAGIEVPGRIGLLAGMGTRILGEAGISLLAVDFVALGERAVAGPLPDDGGPALEFSLRPGETT